MNIDQLVQDYMDVGGLSRDQAIAQIRRDLASSKAPARSTRPASSQPRDDSRFRAAAREHSRLRAAALRQRQLEAIRDDDPLLQAADFAITKAEVRQKYAIVQDLKANGRPVPKQLLSSIRTDLDWLEGINGQRPPERATR